MIKLVSAKKYNDDLKDLDMKSIKYVQKIYGEISETIQL